MSIDRESCGLDHGILDSLRVLCRVPGVYELRCLGFKPRYGRPQIVSGYYDDLEAMARDADAYDGAGCKGIYLTLNPVNPDLLARAENRAREGVFDDDTTKDQHTAKRIWLPIDADPRRVSGVSSTDAEHEAALERALRIRDWLRQDFQFPDPVRADSGNGGHLDYAIDLPNDEESHQLLRNFLVALAARWDDDKVTVDQTVHNAARIWKVYGTWARKGDDTEARPHRRARILEVPESIQVVPRELLRKVAEPAQEKKEKPARLQGLDRGPSPLSAKVLGKDAGMSGSFDVPAWLTRHGLEVRKEGRYGTDGHKWELKVCPFDSTHTGGCAVVMRRAGRLCFKCHHNSCSGKGWKDLRAHFGETPHAARGGGKAAALRLKELAEEAAEELFTSAGIAYASLRTGRRLECHKVASAPFRRWLSGLAVDAGISPSGGTVADAVACLEAVAFRGVERQVHLRLARVADTVYVDLADEQGRCVEVTKDGWRVLDEAPMPFLRHDNMAPLPVPAAGCRLDDLLAHVNVNPEDWPLLRGWLLDCYKGRGPYLVALVNGEQGSAKSTTTRRLRSVVDPAHKAGARRLQRDTNELMIAAERAAVLCFDNVSSLPQWLSDDLASLATGAGMGVRTLYSQDEERVYGSARPILFNGIPDFAESSDLLDRAVKVTCPPIPDDRRLADDELEAAFQAALPGILGGLFDAVAGGLLSYGSADLPFLPRMASSAKWVHACEAGIGQAGRFVAAYEACRIDLGMMTLDNSPVAAAILNWLGRQKLKGWPGWKGRPSDLLAIVRDHTPWDVLTHGGFPKTPKAFSEQMARLAPAFRKAGVLVERVGKSNGVRTMRVTRCDPAVTISDPAATLPATLQKPTGHKDLRQAGSQGSQSGLSSTRLQKEEKSDNNRVNNRDSCDPCDPVRPCRAEPAPRRTLAFTADRAAAERWAKEAACRN